MTCRVVRVYGDDTACHGMCWQGEAAMGNDVWILGATGRSGRGIARRLHETGHSVVLAGRDADRLRSTAADLGNADVVSGSFESLLAQIHSTAPAVVVNTIGPF